ncbi:hypothetical protein [Porphyromonas catoniae]|uniref:hypothetical protein n=1 Tax=Porphyromonas catoniae TaxID=41976 RepID=UPI0028D61080|nr:hypothetical protein [Porphyromonas catoniae]
MPCTSNEVHGIVVAMGSCKLWRAKGEDTGLRQMKSEVYGRGDTRRGEQRVVEERRGGRDGRGKEKIPQTRCKS